MQKTFIFLSCLFSFSLVFSQNRYTIPENPWPESFGNHRAVLHVERPSDAVNLMLEWRRHDSDPEKKLFLIIEEATGDTIPILNQGVVNQEKCELIFGPIIRPGTYYFYYLPYQVQEGYGFYGGKYLPPVGEVNRIEKDGEAEAKLIKIEARTAFDSFYPMEVIALATEKERLAADHDAPFIVFPEDRQFPIRMQDEIPHKWIQSGPSSSFVGTALKNEYYAFQLGIYAVQSDINKLEVLLEGKNAAIPITCFNTSGIDPYGKPFTKTINIEKDHVQALWFGLDIPKDIESGTYQGKIILSISQATNPQSFQTTISFSIKILDQSLPDRGDSETWRHSRLRWLNSTAGLDNEPVKPYSNVRLTSENTSQTTTTKITRDRSGLPAQIEVNDTILKAPVNFQLMQSGQKMHFSYQTVNKPEMESGEHRWEHSWINEKVKIELSSTLEFDGYQRYTLSLNVKEVLDLDDIILNIPFDSDIATHMMGMGLPGCSTPEFHKGKWVKPQDSFWIGNSRGGLWCEIRGSSYHGPLQNLYKPGHPRPWYNDDKGYLSVERNNEITLAKVGTGQIELRPDEEWIFEFALLPTPVKELNPADQFTNRYYHSGGAPDEVESDLYTGIKILNVHHANQYNPYINYPFIAVDTLQGLVDRAHDMGLKIKIYYTIRELTNHVTEIWALRSLGNEILRDGGGGGYPWLREHFVSGYHPQWYQHFESGSPDASVLTATTASRWYNYYIEGLKWLIKNQEIDGLYLDDVSFDRRILKRMRKVMEETKPGCLIDLHSNTGFSKGPAIQYTGYFPYVDKLWFGESFQYNQMSADNWFVEVSGIPFGLMGDMLHGGGNRWLGMLFGMTVRLPWTSEGNTADPRPVWKFWDDYGIASAEMIGFWDDCPVSVDYVDERDDTDEGDYPDVQVTVYKKSDEFLIAIGNFGNENQTIELEIDWKKLGFKSADFKLVKPAITGFQGHELLKHDEKIKILSKEGCLIVVSPIKK